MITPTPLPKMFDADPKVQASNRRKARAMLKADREQGARDDARAALEDQEMYEEISRAAASD